MSRSPVYHNHQGKTVINGRIMPTTTVEAMPDRADEDEIIRASEQPLIDATVKEIIHEVNEMRRAGTLRPFVEGEAIGALPRMVEPVCSAVDPRHEQRCRMEDQRREMLALRRSNDATMRRLTGCANP